MRINTVNSKYNLLIINGKWSKDPNEWATKDANGDMSYKSIRFISENLEKLPQEIQKKIKKEIREYEYSQRDGVFVRDGGTDSVSIHIKKSSSLF